MFNSEFVRKIKADVFEALLPMAREPIEKTDFDEVLMYLENVVKNLRNNTEMRYDNKVYWK